MAELVDEAELWRRMYEQQWTVNAKLQKKVDEIMDAFEPFGRPDGFFTSEHLNKAQIVFSKYQPGWRNNV